MNKLYFLIFIIFVNQCSLLEDDEIEIDNSLYCQCEIEAFFDLEIEGIRCQISQRLKSPSRVYPCKIWFEDLTRTYSIRVRDAYGLVDTLVDITIGQIKENTINTGVLTWNEWEDFRCIGEVTDVPLKYQPVSD